MPIKYQKRMQWLRPYVNAVKDLVPINRIESIKGYTTPLDKMTESEALIHLPEGRRKYKISIRIMDNDYMTMTQAPSFLAIILNRVAHEAAHLKHWEHTPEHLILECRITQRFAKILKKKGIKDTWKRIVL